MTKSITKPFIGILLILFCSSGTKPGKDAMSLYNEIDKKAAPNTLTKKEKKKGWQLLFDGTTNKGWHGYNLTGVPDCWTIEDGTLTMNTKGGAESQDVITDKSYRNFAFYAEFKLTQGANSGIIYQVAEDKKYKFPYETGPEFQVIDTEGYPGKLEDWQTCGANYAMNPPMVKPYKPVGEWNQALIVVNGNDVTFILNGQETVRYTKNSPEWVKQRNSGKWADYPDYGKYDEGHISLQNHGSKVFYRNIKLKEL
jgi:3-keto-disaccharide hydrolase